MQNIPSRQRKALITLTMITLAYVLWMSMHAGIAQAASGISPRYDGVYSGMAEPASNSLRCQPFAVDQVAIKGGHLKSPSGEPAIKGFITEEGYVSASMTGPDMKPAEMDGRAEGDTIVAGYVDDAQKCDWVVRLRKQQ
jgi:hypothetical protein